ncbi:MAG: TetR family transcriptional regulator [Acidimicrobiaceae bacterium]|nr:TetR family transcriptional regulator [Acidimicrobiaceae bacterium]
MELYADRGFDQTTVAEIAERAGLAERTFFRHFADKREVLFSGAAELQDLLVTTVAEAPSSATPIEVITRAVVVAGEVLQVRRDFARQRHAVIAANPELQERELIKLATLASAMAAALRQRGVKEQSAALAAEVGVAAFKIGFERWIKDSDAGDLPRDIRESLDELRAVANGQ